MCELCTASQPVAAPLLADPCNGRIGSARGPLTANGVGGEGSSLTSWTKSPLIAVRVLQDPGSYASTATLRFTTKDALGGGDSAELCLWCIHSKVLECFWESETFPSRVVVDDVLN